MRMRIVTLTIAIVLLVILALFGFNLKEKAIKGMVNDIPEYNCGDENICTSCMIGGHVCGCGEHVCNCGNKTVDKMECSLYS